MGFFEFLRAIDRGRHLGRSRRLPTTSLVRFFSAFRNWYSLAGVIDVAVAFVESKTLRIAAAIRSQGLVWLRFALLSLRRGAIRVHYTIDSDVLCGT